MRAALLRCIVAFAAFAPVLAFAHAVLVGSTPPDRGLVAEPPRELRLLFNEPVTALAANVIGPGGRDFASARRIVDQTLLVELRGDAPAGAYLASYRVVSADGHPVAGAIAFSIGSREPSAAAPDATVSGPSDRIDILPRLPRALYLASLFAAAGGALFGLLVTRRPPAGSLGRWMSAAATLALVLAVVNVGVYGVELRGEGPERFLDPGAWSMAWSTSRGRALAVGALAAVLLALAPRLPMRGCVALSLCGALLAAASLAMSGHAATAEPRPLAAALWFLHAACVAFWLGSLLPLRHALGTDATAAARTVARFSGLAMLAVPVLMGAGVVMLVLLVRNPIALADSAYGSLLGLKLSLVAAMLALAVYNRLRLAPAISGDERARRRLGLTIGVEIALALAILVTTAVFAGTEPPRARAAAPAALRIASGEFVADVALSRVGTARRLGVRLLHDGVHLWTPLEVAVELSRPEDGIEPLRRTLELQPDGSFVAEIETLPVGGAWSIRIEALMTEFSKQNFSGSIVIP